MPFDQLEDQRAIAIGLFDAVNRPDVRMIDGREDAGFTLEPRATIRILEKGSGQDLDRDVATEFRVLGAVDLTHATGAEAFDDLVVRDLHSLVPDGSLHAASRHHLRPGPERHASIRRMKRRTVWTLSIVAVVAAAPYLAGRPQAPVAAPTSVDATLRTQVIDGAIEHMRKAYIFADVAEKMAEAVRANAAKNEYDSITAPRDFAERLTRDLQAVSHDKHLRIVFNPDGLPARSGPPTPEERARGLAEERRRNFGFEKVERLDGNVGYIDLRGFSGTPESKDVAVAAMNFVADTDALIFDLRRNGGGSPFMIGILSSYLFTDVVHLNDFYIRETDSKREFFTTAEVQGRRFGKDKPVYVLTSNRTFSAAEEFTYNLKNLKRSTTVGETTGGGAHPGGVRPITAHFGIWLPNGRAINPITKTNWEGTGIEPDIKTASGQALQAAHLDALKKILATATDPRHREQLESAIAAVQKSSNP